MIYLRKQHLCKANKQVFVTKMWKHLVTLTTKVCDLCSLSETPAR